MIKLKKDFLITVLTVLIPLIMQFFYIRYVSYNVDQAIYGNFILLQTLLSALSYIYLQIPTQAYDRYFNAHEYKQDFVNEFRTLLIFINIGSFFTIIIYGLIMKKFDALTLGMIFLYFVLLNNYSFNQKIFLLNLERKKYFYLKVLEGVAKFVTPIIFYYYFQTLESFILGLFVGYLLAFVFLNRYLGDYPYKIKVNASNYKKYFYFAYPILFVSIFSWGITFSDRYFIEFLSSTENVGIYSILAQVAGFGQILGQIFSMYIAPKVLNLYEKNAEEATVYFNHYFKLLVLIFVFLSLFYFLIPIEVFTILIERSLIENGHNYAVLYILTISVFFSVLQTQFSMYFKLYHKLHILAYIYLLGFILNLLGNYYITEYGILAAAISTLCAYILIMFLQIIYIKKISKMKIFTWSKV